MTGKRRLTGPGVVVVVLGMLIASASVALAQGPFTAYGTGLSAGDVVEASIGGTSCGTATADADGNWILRIESTAPCNPSEGDQIAFSRNGIPAGDVATWTAGGTPATSGYDADVGITLMTATSGPSGDGPAPADTGDGVVVDARGESLTLLLVLSALAAALVFVARTGTRHRSSGW